MGKKFIFSLILVLTSFAGLQVKAKADYWLVIGSYRQGPGGKPQVSGITSPSLFAIPIGIASSDGLVMPLTCGLPPGPCL